MRFVLTIVFSFFLSTSGLAGGDEESTVEEKDIEIGFCEQIYGKQIGFPIDHPDRGSDVDVDRIKYLASASESLQVMPEDIACSIKKVGGDQAMRTYRNTLVIGSVVVVSTVSIYFIPCGLMNMKNLYCSSASQYGFELVGIGVSTGSSYLAQKLYESERANFEESRNKHQDNLRQLEHIYQDISKALFRNYLSNLYLAKENIEESNLDFGKKLRLLIEPEGELILDQYLWDLKHEQDQLLLFADILGFLENLKYVFTEMMHRGVPEYTVRRIKLRFDQLSALIVGSKYIVYKENLFSLIFAPGEPSQVKKRLSINRVITSEDLNSMLPL